MWIPREVHAHLQRSELILPLRGAKKVLEASLRRSDIPRLIGCIAQHFPGSPLSTLHCVGGRLALCLCLYFTETSCCAAVGT
ncbi:hypothetical protein G5714_013210 [Onychostoma macrolepis]|uniref:Uncharacterized protein n=1 Tax=Onychostoma macrolepis TaxID=369639 RepID=A0A7J6CE18_9TELE|nr:hypothetical protein G5714_013210 [Onychostoma macrolepis]